MTKLVLSGDTRSHRVYLRPRVPSKLEGRTGTRRQYKRDFPPGHYVLTRRYDGAGNLTGESFWR